MMLAAFPKLRPGGAGRAAADNTDFFADGGFAPAFGQFDRSGVHEPRFENCLRQFLQRLICLPVQLNLVVQRTQYACDDPLLGWI